MILALSFINGINFFVRSKNRKTTISMTLDSDGNISMKKQPGIHYFRRLRVTPIRGIVSLLCAELILHATAGLSYKIITLIFIAALWLRLFLFNYIDYKNPNLSSLHRFHAAEHKSVAYINKYNKPPETIEEIAQMPSITKDCGKSTSVHNLAILSSIAFGCMFIPTVILKVIWALFSILYITYLWDTDKLNFIQKLSIMEPTETELKLAQIGIAEYWKMKEEADS